MIDQVLNDLIDEIALEGEQGCTFEQLFNFAESLFMKSLEAAPLDRPICFDMNYKAYFWTHLRQVDQLVFTENGITIDPSNLTFQEIQLKSESNQVIVKACEDSQDRNIYGSLKTEKKGLTDNHKLLMNTIAKSRHQGISQVKLGETLGMDTKTIFYYLKKLESLGLIVKESAYVAKMTTRIIFLKRFANQQDKKEDNGDDNNNLYRVGDFKINIIKHLTEAKDNMMTLQDIIKAMGFVTIQNVRWARIKINKLHDEGIIEKFIAFDGKRQKPSVRLPNTKNTVKEDPISIEEDTTSIKLSKKHIENLFRDLPGDYQFYQDIVASGEKGLVRQELVDKYPDLDPNAFKLFFENVASPPATQALAKYSVYRTEELGGKNRLFRYFAWEGWKKFNENIGKQVTEPQVKSKITEPKLVEPTSIDYIGKSFNILPSTKLPISRLQNKKKKKSDTANSSDEEEESAPKPRAKKSKTKETTFQAQTVIIDLREPPKISDSNPEPENKRVTRKRGAQIQQEPEPNLEPEIKQSTRKRKVAIEPEQPSGPEPETKCMTRKQGNQIEPRHQSIPTSEQVPTQPTSTRRTLRDYFGKNKPSEPVENPRPSDSTPTISEAINSVPDSSESPSIDSQPNKRKLDQDTHTEEHSTYQFVDFNTSPTRPRPKKSKRQSSELNSTKLRRCKILLDMMKEQHIRELNQETANEFNKIEMATPGGQKMAVTTFNKMAKQLHAEKKLTVYVSTIQKLYGLTEIKTFLLHSSLSPESEEVKQFISSYSVEKPAINTRAKRKEFKTVDVEELPTVQDIEKPEPKIENPAVYYGWIKSKWIRARKLHENLMKYYLISNRNDDLIDMAEFTKNMPMKTLTCLCSNLPYSEEEFRKFLDIKENGNIPLSKLPENIQPLILQSRAKIRHVIVLLIDVLEALGVIKPIHDDKIDKSIIAPKYILSEEGPIRDYAFKDRAIISTLPLKTVQDVNQFWDELYTTCIHPTRFRTEQDEKELLETFDKDDPLYYIHRRRGWVVHTIVTSEQKEILNSFVDFETKTIPSDSIALRIHLMKETGLSSREIRTYYAGITGALDKMKKREAKQKAQEQRQLEMRSDPTINNLMLASFERRKVNAAIQKAKETGPFIQPTFVGSRKLRRLRLRTEPGQDQDHTDYGHSKRLFHDFSKNEQDLLLYSYCIMKTRAKRSKFFWLPITTLLTNRTKEQCRRVLNTMLSREPELAITIERLKSKWEKYYQQGIKNKEIEDDNVWDTYNFDLRSYVEYFIRKMLEDEAQSNTTPECPLPFYYEDVKKYCRIIRDEQHIIEAKKAADDQGLSVNAFNDNIYDTSDKIIRLQNDDISVELVKILIKMLLVTPDDLYDANKAYKVMSQYPSNTIEKALEDLRSYGLIVKDKSRYDRIPGRSFNVSEKYLKIAEGVIPFGLIDNARIHYTTIVSNEVLDLNNLNSGIAASTLDLLSQGKIMLDIKQRERFLKPKESVYYPKKSAVKLRNMYVYNGLDLVIKRKCALPIYRSTNKPKYLDAKFTIPNSNEIKNYLQNLESENELTKIVYEAVKHSEVNGVSFDDIVSYIGPNYDIHTISNTIYDLVHHEPPLIRVVGFKQLRYVAVEFCAPWFLKNDDTSLLNPLMWNDASGNTIESALDGCAKAVLSHILTLPGISHNNLFKKFEHFFSEYELYMLMRYLIDNKIVIARKIQRETRSKKVSIFQKRPVISLSQPMSLMNSNQMTFYWLSDDYYLLK